jgi:uncharacterized protein YciI
VGLELLKRYGMFVLELTCTGSLNRVDELLVEHMTWLKSHYETGVFIASGRKEPRNGGVILAVGNDKPAIETLVTTDPISVAGICEYRITHFSPPLSRRPSTNTATGPA